jgi:hypothetical protein
MKKLLVVVAIVVIGVVGWRVRSHRAPDALELDAQDGKSVLVDRLWLDHVPSGPRDAFNILALISEDNVGVFQNTTAYRGNYEMFQFSRNGWKFPQTGDVDKPTIRVVRCDEKGMDFCMDISGNSRGVHRYYSRKDWVIKSLADEQALAAKLDAAR